MTEINGSSVVDRPEVREITRILAAESLSLTDRHKIGELMQLISESPEGGKSGKWRQHVASFVKASESTLSKCLQFFKKYSVAEIPTVEATGAGWGKVSIALGIEVANDRHRLLRESVVRGWPDADLQRAVQSHNGRRRGGGRTPNEPRSHGLVADLGRLEQVTNQWLRFNETWESNFEGYFAETADLEDLAWQRLNNQLRKTESLLDELKNARSRCVVAVAELRRGR